MSPLETRTQMLHRFRLWRRWLVYWQRPVRGTASNRPNPKPWSELRRLLRGAQRSEPVAAGRMWDIVPKSPALFCHRLITHPARRWRAVRSERSHPRAASESRDDRVKRPSWSIRQSRPGTHMRWLSHVGDCCGRPASTLRGQRGRPRTWARTIATADSRHSPMKGTEWKASG